MEYWIEGAGGGKVELHTGFLELTHCNNRPLVSDAAEEGWMMLLEEVVAIFPRRGKSGEPRMVPGGTRNRHLSMQREMPAAVKMLMVSVATRSAMRPSCSPNLLFLGGV